MICTPREIEQIIFMNTSSVREYPMDQYYHEKSCKVTANLCRTKKIIIFLPKSGDFHRVSSIFSIILFYIAFNVMATHYTIQFNSMAIYTGIAHFNGRFTFEQLSPQWGNLQSENYPHYITPNKFISKLITCSAHDSSKTRRNCPRIVASF